MDARDTIRFSPPSPSDRPAYVPACSVCGRQDHTLRIASYPYVFSLVVLTFRRAFTGTWCARHGRLRWLLAGLITAGLGWIGFPFGLLFTPVALFRLAQGGEQLPDQNRGLLTSLAEHKLSRGDADGAIRCLEAALEFGDDAAIHERLRSLYVTHRSLSGTRQPHRAVPIVVALLGAWLAGLAAGALEYTINDWLWPLIQDSDYVFGLVLDWVPLLALAFAVCLLLSWLIRWSLVRVGCRQAALAVAVALCAAGLAAYGLAVGEMVVQYIDVLQMSQAPFSASGVIRTAGAVLTRGGLLEILTSLQAGGLRLVYGLVLLSAGICYAGLGVDVAMGVVGWRRRLAAIEKEVSIEPPASAAPGWLALASVVLALALAVGLTPQHGLVDYMESFYAAWDGWELLNEEGPEAALPDLEEAVRLDPESAAARFFLGSAYYGQGRIEEAAAELEESIRLDPALTAAYGTLAWAYLDLDRLDEAMASCREALRQNPDYADPHVVLGMVFLEQEDYPAAQEAFEAAIALDPEYAEAQQGLAAAHTLQAAEGAVDDALEPLVQAVSLDPENAFARFQLGVLRQARGEFEQAVEHYTVLAEIEPDWALPHALLASAYYSMGDDARVEQELQKASSLQPEDNLTCYTLGCVYRDLGRMQEAETHFLRALELSDSPEIEYVVLAWLYYRQDRFDLALEMCQKALQTKEDHVDAYLARADVYAAQDHFAQALAEIERALEISADDASAHSSLCFVYWRTGRAEEAVREGEEAVRLQPYDAGAQTGLALAYQAAGRLEPAIAAAQEAIRLSPRYDTSHYALGLCHAAAGDAAQAAQEFQTFLDLYQDRPLSREYKAQAEAYLAGVAP